MRHRNADGGRGGGWFLVVLRASVRHIPAAFPTFGSASPARSPPPAPATTPATVPDTPAPVAPHTPPRQPPTSTRLETRSNDRRTSATPARADDNSNQSPPTTSDAAPPHPASCSPETRNAVGVE